MLILVTEPRRKHACTLVAARAFSHLQFPDGTLILGRFSMISAVTTVTRRCSIRAHEMRWLWREKTKSLEREKERKTWCVSNVIRDFIIFLAFWAKICFLFPVKIKKKWAPSDTEETAGRPCACATPRYTSQDLNLLNDGSL